MRNFVTVSTTFDALGKLPETCTKSKAMQLLECNFAGTETEDGDFLPLEPELFIPDREESLPLSPLSIPVPETEQGAIDPDSLEIEDAALNAAVSDYRAASRTKASERGSWAAAIGLALIIHAGFVAACIVLALMYKLWLPRLELTQGAGSSESGLVADDTTATTSQAGGIPGQAVAMPNPPRPLNIEHPSEVNDTTTEPSETPTLRTTAAELETPLDRVLIGLATNSAGPMPVWPHAVVQKAPTAAQASASNSPTIAAPPSRAVPMKHLFVAPRGVGGVARGNEGSGLDSRGLPVPEYPAESRRCHEEGIVAFKVQVNSDGSVGAIKLAKDSGFPRLNDAAFTSLRTARFVPATEDGKPIATTVLVPYRFILR
jgi:protein TonB